jgi:predicted nuclease of predicted toxin-antitoxin system
MSLRFFADHCVSNLFIRALLEKQHEVHRLRDHLAPDADDRQVIDKAQELDSILLSLDGDFADIIAYPPSDYKGIVCLQVKNRPEITPQILSRLLHYLSFFPNLSHYQGRLILIEASRIRTRT